jgi:ABC-type transporter Mla subunit MlaD
MSSLRYKLRQLVDPRPARTRSHHVRNGAIVMAVTAFGTVAAVTHDIPLVGGVPGEPVRVEFAEVNEVDDNTPVRVDGADVGEVQKIEAGSDPRRRSLVTLRITDEGVAVRRDARADIRWKTLLGGEKYVDLDPGSPSAAPLGNGVIDVGRTSTQVEFDDVLRPYDGTTEQAQRGLLKGLAEGFGSPEGIARTLETLPALRTVQRGLSPLRGRERRDLRLLVAATARTVEALGQDTSELQALVDGAARTLAATNRRREELGEFVELSPPTLDETAATTRRLRTTLDHLDPLVAELRPGARALAPAANAAIPALRQADALLGEARPLLRDAGPTFASLRRASRTGVPLLRGLDPAVRRLDAEVLPILRQRDEETRLRMYEAIGPFMASLAASGAEFDAEGHRFRLTVPGGSNSVVTLARTNLARSCQRRVPRARRDECGALAQVLAQGWLGRGR